MFEDIDNVLKEIRDVFVQILSKYNLDNSRLVKNSKFIHTGDGNISIDMFDYANYVDSGRGPGSPPPIGSIIRFIQRKNITPPAGTNIEQLAYAIANSIGKRGIRARPFLEKLQEEINTILTRYYNEKVIEILKQKLNAK